MSVLAIKGDMGNNAGRYVKSDGREVKLLDCHFPSEEPDFEKAMIHKCLRL